MPADTVCRVQLTVVDHPLARARLTKMRDERTDNAMFRAALAELTQMLVYEATRNLAVVEEPIRTPVTDTIGYRLAAPPLIVPVLRAGLGMADTAHGMLPESQMGMGGTAVRWRQPNGTLPRHSALGPMPSCSPLFRTPMSDRPFSVVGHGAL